MFTAVVDLPTPPLPDATAINVADAGRGFNPPWTAWGATRQVTATRAGQPRLGRQQALERRRELGGVPAGREAELDLDNDRSGFGPDGLHSFGLRQGHPEMGFDIIPDHKAGLADAIVCHVSGQRIGGETACAAGGQL